MEFTQPFELRKPFKKIKLKPNKALSDYERLMILGICISNREYIE